MKLNILALTVLLALSACGKKIDITPAPAAAKPTQPSISVDQGLTALLRATIYADKACYDAGRDAWWLHWPDDKDEDGQVVYLGWFEVPPKEVNFYYVQKNNTWFTTPKNTDMLVPIRPDTTGLDCKTATEIVRER